MNRLIGNLSIVLLSLLPIWTWAANEGEPQQYRELNVVGITGQQSYHLKCAGQGSPTTTTDATNDARSALFLIEALVSTALSSFSIRC